MYMQRKCVTFAASLILKRKYLSETAVSGVRSTNRVSLTTLHEKYKRGEPITAITAYDYPSAVHVRDFLNVQTAGPFLIYAI
jgi:hypothetical protein